jgi:hypothetical protein
MDKRFVALHHQQNITCMAAKTPYGTVGCVTGFILVSAVYAGVQQMLYQAVDYFDRQIADIIFVVFL